MTLTKEAHRAIDIHAREQLPDLNGCIDDEHIAILLIGDHSERRRPVRRCNINYGALYRFAQSSM